MAFKHVLVPTDFSEPGNYAVRYAMEEATLHGAKVTLLHVQQSSSAGTDIYYVSGPVGSGLEAGYDVVAGGRLGTGPVAEPTVVRRDLGEEALTRLRDLVAGSFQGEWAVEIAEGRPADAIVRLAQERHVDLIVMATHGRTGLEHVLIGSVAEKVVRLAPCPVLTVKLAPTQDPPLHATA
jgi:nucleotide-binding universal stress UspA family protein